MGYDHRHEVARLRSKAEELRKCARLEREKIAEIEREAKYIEAEANSVDERANHVHRLCTAGASPPASCCQASEMIRS